MGRFVGRSKGCKTCLQRRIRCDEKFPECTQCLSQNKKCPGPTVGACFIDMTPKKSQKIAVKGKDIVKSKNRVDIGSLPVVEAPPTRKDKSQSKYASNRGSSAESTTRGLSKGEEGTAVFEYSNSSEFMMPSPNQPSKSAPFQQLFLCHFISAFDNRNLHRTQMKSWYWELPVIVATSTCPAALHSIRAASMLHYGVLSKDISVQTEARRWYSRGLNSQRRLLESGSSKTNAIMPGAEEILSSVMLTLFELVVATTPLGWIQHILAAARMLIMRGPENCQSGLVHMLFRTMRMTVVYASIATEKPHVFAMEAWTTVPFALHPKNTNDGLIDILLLIPGCLAQYNMLHDPNVDLLGKEAICSELKTAANSMICQLQDWWLQYIEEIATEPFRSIPRSLETCIEPGTYVPGNFEYRDAFTAAFIASYHATYVIMHSMLAYVIAEPEFHNSCVTSHIDHILAAANYLLTIESTSEGTLMMVFPLKIVVRWALDPLQAQFADHTLAKWGRKKGIEGICKQEFTPRCGPKPTIYVFQGSDRLSA